MTKQPFKVAVIGSAGHYEKVLDDFRGADVEVVGVTPGYSGESVEAVMQHALCAHATEYESFESLLADSRPNIAIVNSRFDLMAEISTQAAEAGCHVISEKPIAMTLDSLDRLKQALDKACVRFMAMLNMREELFVCKARALYLQGLVGRPIIINARKSYRWGNARPEFFGKRELYGGTIGWVGIHAFDMVQYVTGDRFTRVAAMHGNLAHPEHAECEDHCGILAEMDTGAHVTVSVDYHRPLSAKTHGDDWIRIVGDRGILESGVVRNACVLLNEDGETVFELDEDQSSSYLDFLEAIRSGSDLEQQPGDTAFHLTQTCLLARDAADDYRLLGVAAQ